MEAFWMGLLGAVISTLPIGPINIILIQMALQKRWDRWVACVGGVVLVDSVYSLTSVIFKEKLQTGVAQYSAYSSWILAFVLFVIGVGMILYKPKTVDFKEEGRSLFAYFLVGVVSTALEPALPIFWLSWWGAAPISNPVMSSVSGVVIGDLFVFGGYAALSVLIPKPSLKTQEMISKTFGTTLIFSALVAIILGMKGK